MKKLAAILCLSALATGAFAQGQISFNNGTTTLISYQTGSMPSAQPLPATAGQYFFGIFTAPVGTTDPLAFTFSNTYGTNLAVAGRLTGGATAQVAGWNPGTARAVLVRGWSADIGHDWNPAWLTGITGAGPNTVFGTSAIAPSMTAGGFDGTGNVPAPVLFSSTGIPTGFTLVPEPTTMALAGLGAAALLIFRRRK